MLYSGIFICKNGGLETYAIYFFSKILTLYHKKQVKKNKCNLTLVGVYTKYGPRNNAFPK
jgi:hypothetical protein